MCAACRAIAHTVHEHGPYHPPLESTVETPAIFFGSRNHQNWTEKSGHFEHPTHVAPHYLARSSKFRFDISRPKKLPTRIHKKKYLRNVICKHIFFVESPAKFRTRPKYRKNTIFVTTDTDRQTQDGTAKKPRACGTHLFPGVRLGGNQSSEKAPSARKPRRVIVAGVLV